MTRFFAIAVLGFAILTGGGCARNTEWTTSTGLKVIETQQGEGPVPKRGDVLGIIYRASYLDGKQFDSYQSREDPYRFRLGFQKVFAGLEEGIATMRAGGKRTLIMPPELAFGKEGGGMIPPDTWVKFEVELIEIQPGPVLPQPWSDVGYDIITTESGLQYIDYYVGTGESPKLGGEIVIHYSGFLDDGTLFDSSFLSGMPISITLGGDELIRGWIEGLLTMKEGGQRKLIIPPYLAFGDKGFGKKIPPNATLTYDIELIQVID